MARPTHGRGERRGGHEAGEERRDAFIGRGARGGSGARPAHRFLPVLARTAVLLSVLALLVPWPRGAAAAGPTVELVHLEGEINAVTAGYVTSALARAGSDHAGGLVILMNTPGGISTAMDEIVAGVLNAPVPVAVFVSPIGARAASAGLFVAQAADVVAMAPSTNIGSAHPVTGSGRDIAGDLGQKVLNDAVARVRNLAALHHRNADWCEQAVRQSVNVGAEEAARLGVVDLQAATVPALLAALDGRAAPRPSGRDLTFRTAGADVRDEPMSTFQQILQALIDPNVAYILMLVAIFGLLTELTSPGAILPGVLGGLSAILALVALSTLPINLGGILLVAFAFLLFVVDVKAPTHGILTVGGLLSLLLGSAFLFDTGPVGGVGGSHRRGEKCAVAQRPRLRGRRALACGEHVRSDRVRPDDPGGGAGAEWTPRRARAGGRP